MQNTIEVSNALRELAALLEFSKAPKFKIRAYQRAAEVVSTVGDLGPLVEQGRLADLEGIGASLSRQIEELWNTGASQYLVRLRSEQPPGASELILIEGMTPRRLRALVDALGIRSVSELRQACVDGKVAAVRGFGKKTEANLLLACDRWQNRGEESPAPTLLARALDRVVTLQAALGVALKRAELVGDVRRGEETVRELEWVVLGDAERAIEQLSALRQVLRVERESATLYLSEGLTLRLYPADAESFGNAVVLRTGNAAHVEAVRARAAKLGWSIADWPTGPAETALPSRSFASEQNLYAALQLAFVPPELRSGTGELAQAERESFGDLLALSDITGMVHCHTSYSDGQNSILEMAQAAQALGMKYITITDHSPSAHYASGVTLDRLKQQWEEIARAQEAVAIRILKGTESDILSDGSLDFPDAVLEQFDVDRQHSRPPPHGPLGNDSAVGKSAVTAAVQNLGSRLGQDPQPPRCHRL